MGIVAGGYIGASALGMGLPDDAEYLPFAMMIGAGAGWLGGAGLGWLAGAGARDPGATGRRLVLLGAASVVIGALAIAIWPISAGWPDGGVTLFSAWRAGGGQTAFEVMIVVDAALAASTFVVVSKKHGGPGSAIPGRVAGAIGITGLLLGGLAFPVGVGLVGLAWSDAVAGQRSRAVYRTASSLEAAAGRHEARTGSFPTDLEDALAAGAKVRPGTKVEFVGVVDGSFCVRVGVDDGEGPPDDPHYSGLVHPRPPGSSTWVSSEVREGNSCTSGAQGR